MLTATKVPRWVQALLTENFFTACAGHGGARKNEKNVFCLDCAHGICPDCLPDHHSHRLLQIRRYVYHDVIRLVDADKLMDCGQVQSYTTNSAKVLFLNERPQARPPRTAGNVCVSCDRNLQDSYLFCSVSCKIKHRLRSGSNLSKYLRKCEFLALPDPGLDDGRMRPDSVLERSGSGSSSGGEAGFLPVNGISELMLNRRKKGTPHRSPLY